MPLLIPPSESFIVLENLVFDKTSSRVIHVIKPDEKKSEEEQAKPGEKKTVFRLGRGHEADIKVSDISVSRLHAAINCRKDGIFIEDNQSKFGTLALVQNIGLGPSISRAVQVGRTAISLAVQPYKLES